MFKIPRLSKRWRFPKILYGLFVLELCLTVAGLTIYGIASPDLYRTTLWQIGYDNGWNSNPKQILYAYANYRPIPKTPFVWSLELTEYNMVVSVLSLFLLLVKAVMFVMHIWWPVLAVPTNLALTVMWTVSIWGQAGPDYSDPNYPSASAWYVTKSCDVARSYGAYGYCQQAKAGFAIAVVTTAIFLANLVFGVWSCFPSKAEREMDKLDVDELQGGVEAKGSPVSDSSGERIWEMSQVRMAHENKQPFTPRTLAFNTLDRQLPLRQQSYS